MGGPSPALASASRIGGVPQSQSQQWGEPSTLGTAKRQTTGALEKLGAISGVKEKRGEKKVKNKCWQGHVRCAGV